MASNVFSPRDDASSASASTATTAAEAAAGLGATAGMMSPRSGGKKKGGTVGLGWKTVPASHVCVLRKAAAGLSVSSWVHFFCLGVEMLSEGKCRLVVLDVSRWSSDACLSKRCARSRCVFSLTRPDYSSERRPVFLRFDDHPGWLVRLTWQNYEGMLGAL